MKIALAWLLVVFAGIPLAAGLPAAPAGLVASPLNGRVWLEWTAVPGADSYAVKRAETAGGPYLPIATGVVSRTFTDFTAVNGTEHFYVVAGVEGSDEGPVSAEALAVPNAYQNAPVAVSTYPGTIKLACVGDSITAGYSNTAGMSYPSQLAALLGSKWNVQNYGVNSRTLLKATPESYWSHTQFTAAQNFLPDVVVIMLGANDSKPGYWNPVNFAADYDAMIATFQNLGSKPRIFVCRPTFVPEPGNFRITDAVIRQQIPIIDKAALNRSVGLIDHYATTRLHPDGFADFVHPNNPGAARIANTVYQALIGGIRVVPDHLTATTAHETVTLNWVGAMDAVAYTVRRALDPAGPFLTVAEGVPGTTYTDTGLTNGTVYHYRILASRESGEPTESEILTAIPNPALTHRAIGGTATASPEGGNGKKAAQAFDGTTGTKWQASNSTSGWLRYDFGQGAKHVVASYRLGSANDWPERDPRDWQLQGSDNGIDWVTLDTRVNQVFTGRFQSVTYPVAAPSACRYYRLNITAKLGPNTGSGVDLQLSEFSLLTTDGPPIGSPPAPDGLDARPGAGRIFLTWNPSPGATGYTLKRSTVDGSSYQPVATDLAGTTFIDTPLSVGTTYHYIVTATSTAGEGAKSAQASATPVSAYQQWKADNHLPPDMPDTATPDGDGIPILMKFATGLTPGQAAVNPVSLEATGSTFSLRFQRLSPAPVNYVVEASGGLSSWIGIATLPKGSDTWSGTASIAEPVAGDLRTVSVTHGVSPVPPQQFLRLRVTP